MKRNIDLFKKILQRVRDEQPYGEIIIWKRWKFSVGTAFAANWTPDARSAKFQFPLVYFVQNFNLHLTLGFRAMKFNLNIADADTGDRLAAQFFT